jgi:hypothetical protein
MVVSCANQLLQLTPVQVDVALEKALRVLDQNRCMIVAHFKCPHSKFNCLY